jgi:RND family efflux transporter MFP subunit
VVPIVIVWCSFALFVAGLVPRMRQASDREREVAASAEVPTVFTSRCDATAAARRLDLPGTIGGLREAPIYARTTGFVKSLRVDLGSSVRAGDTLLVLDMPDITEQARQSRATLEQVEATAQLAHATLERWKNLSAKDAVTRQELEEKQAAANVADASVKAARANAANLSEVLRFGAVLAPFNGVVTTRDVDVGFTGVSGRSVRQPRADDADADRHVAGDDQRAAECGGAGAQRPGREGVRAGTRRRDFRGVVALTARAIDPATRSLLTEVHVTNPDAGCCPACSRTSRFSVGASGEGLRIPSIALIVRADGPQVARVDDGIVHLTPIKLGRDFGTMLEVPGRHPVGSSGHRESESNIERRHDGSSRRAWCSRRRAESFELLAVPAARPSADQRKLE